jgi:hypothetical protein
MHGGCRISIGRKHTLHHQRYHPWFMYRSGCRDSPRDHVHSQSQTQTYLVGSRLELQLPGQGVPCSGLKFLATFGAFDLLTSVSFGCHRTPSVEIDSNTHLWYNRHPSKHSARLHFKDSECAFQLPSSASWKQISHNVAFKPSSRHSEALKANSTKRSRL